MILLSTDTESTFKTPASKSGMTYKRIKNKYTTPKSLPTLSLLRNQLKSSNFIRFQKVIQRIYLPILACNLRVRRDVTDAVDVGTLSTYSNGV